jgi:hypothetical protein
MKNVEIIAIILALVILFFDFLIKISLTKRKKAIIVNANIITGKITAAYITLTFKKIFKKE